MDLPPHAKLHSYGNRGAYSVKVKVCEAANDTMGKVVPYTPSPYIPAYATASKRDALKGKQMSVPFGTKGFGKLEYVPSPYEDKSIKKKDGKLGFCTSKSFGRDDVASMLDTLRYRDALEKEAKYVKIAADAVVKGFQAEAEASAAALGASGGAGSAALHDEAARTISSPARAGVAAAAAGAGSPGKLGLSGKVPDFTSNFDRSRHVSDFVPKVAYAEKYARSYAPGETSSSVYGEGCGERAILESPKHPKTDFTKAFNDKGHLVSPSIDGRAGGL